MNQTTAAWRLCLQRYLAEVLYVRVVPALHVDVVVRQRKLLRLVPRIVDNLLLTRPLLHRLQILQVVLEQLARRLLTLRKLGVVRLWLRDLLVALLDAARLEVQICEVYLLHASAEKRPDD